MLGIKACKQVAYPTKSNFPPYPRNQRPRCLLRSSRNLQPPYPQPLLKPVFPPRPSLPSLPPSPQIAPQSQGKPVPRIQASSPDKCQSGSIQNTITTGLLIQPKTCKKLSRTGCWNPW